MGIWSRTISWFYTSTPPPLPSPSLHCRPETYALAVYYTDKRALRAQAVWSRVRALSRSLVLTSVRFDFSSDWTSLWFFHL